MRKEQREFLVKLNVEVAPGWVFYRFSGTGHAQFKHEPTNKVLTAPGSSSDNRGLKNALATARKLVSGT